MGANRFGRIWKKALPDQPNFYGPNFNYRPMLQSIPIPSTDDVETTFTLIQIGDNMSQYIHNTKNTPTTVLKDPADTTGVDAMDKIVGRYHVCMWKPSSHTDAMDQKVCPTENASVTVETKTVTDTTNAVKVETKRCSVKLVRLETILLGDLRDTNTSKEVTPIQQTPTSPPRLRPRNKTARHTQIPRNASKNKQYTEELESRSPTRHRKSPGKINRPSAGGPSAEWVKAQTQRSEPPSINLPALPSPEIDLYEGDTKIESDAALETPPKPVSQSGTCPKKGTINITQHGVKRKAASRKYKCKECDAVMDSVHELMKHHQNNHNILYCSMCKRPFNNPMSLSRHEYEHKKKNLQCPKCDRTFTFESQVKAHMYSHRSKCGKGFFQ